jgi:hypothetical protein
MVNDWLGHQTGRLAGTYLPASTFEGCDNIPAVVSFI